MKQERTRAGGSDGKQEVQKLLWRTNKVTTESRSYKVKQEMMNYVFTPVSLLKLKDCGLAQQKYLVSFVLTAYQH